MSSQVDTFLTLGVLFLLGFMADIVGRKINLPRVTLLLVVGMILGPGGVHLISEVHLPWLNILADMALLLVGFLLGEHFTLSSLRHQGRLVVTLAAMLVVATVGIVVGGMLMVGISLELALLFAGIATATDPAATTDVIRETGARGPFTQTLLGIVAIDDAMGLVAFSLLLAAAQTISGGGSAWEPLLHGLWEVGGGCLIGLFWGLAMSRWLDRGQTGENTLVGALSMIFLAGGMAIWLETSFLLAAMVQGAVLVNLGVWRERPFRIVERVIWPFLILFFVFAGSSLQPELLPALGGVGLAYILLRIVGRIMGGALGASCCDAPPDMRRWMGLALLPQAGVALGMAMIASQRLPELGKILLPVVIASTVLFEVIGPIITRQALIRVGEARIKE
ncbi:MAG: cation:proton antiporter [Magnetococcales bacterium]|nr:cation:proton antiporter [Magnetococcales bacterium]